MTEQISGLKKAKEYLTEESMKLKADNADLNQEIGKLWYENDELEDAVNTMNEMNISLWQGIESLQAEQMEIDVDLKDIALVRSPFYI